MKDACFYKMIFLIVENIIQHKVVLKSKFISYRLNDNILIFCLVKI